MKVLHCSHWVTDQINQFQMQIKKFSAMQDASVVSVNHDPIAVKKG